MRASENERTTRAAASSSAVASKRVLSCSTAHGARNLRCPISGISSSRRRSIIVVAWSIILIIRSTLEIAGIFNGLSRIVERSEAQCSAKRRLVEDIDSVRAGNSSFLAVGARIYARSTYALAVVCPCWGGADSQEFFHVFARCR